jgi:conjugal transfer mating pair stabilization protein TraG
LHEPDLVDVPKVPVSSAADVEARYHPTGLRAVPTVGGSGDGSAIVAQIDTQTAAIKADQDAKRVIRAGAVEAGSAVRGKVDEAMRKGFFTDPELRK